MLPFQIEKETTCTSFWNLQFMDKPSEIINFLLIHDPFLNYTLSFKVFVLVSI